MSVPMKRMTSREFNHDTGKAKKAAKKGPVVITDRGNPSHVLLSYESYRQLAEDELHLVELLCATPGAGDVELPVPDRSDTGKAAVFD